MKKILTIILSLFVLIAVGQDTGIDTKISQTDDLYYGVQWDITNSSTTVLRIGNSQLHEDLPVQTGMRRCVVENNLNGTNGRVAYYLEDTNSYWKAPFSDTLLPLLADASEAAKTDTLIISGAFTNDESYYKGRYIHIYDSNQYVRIESKVSDDTLTFSADTNVFISHSVAVGDSIVICNARLDGLDGNVMVEIPEHYRKHVASGDIRQVLISTYPLAGYEKIEKQYISAYEAYKDGDTLKSVSGEFPTTNETIGTYRTAASQNGDHWSQLRYDTYETLTWLYLIEYADFDAQTALSTGITDGDGIKWNSYNSNYPVHKTGISNSLGNASGEVSLTLYSFDDIDYSTQVAVYRGVENVYGHIWKFVDGLNVYNSVANGSQAYICTNSADFASDTEAGYTKVGNLAEADGYIVRFLSKTILAETIGGSSSTYTADYHYSYYDNSASSGWLVALWGGAMPHRSFAGFFMWYAYSVYWSSSAYSNIGSRLCLKNTE